MINPFKYVPVRTNQYLYGKDFLETRWGIVIYEANYEIKPLGAVALVPKDTYKKIKAFLKPVEGQYEWQKMTDGVTKAMDVYIKDADKYQHPIGIDRDSLVKLHKHVADQWKERISHSSGYTLLQYNVRASFFRSGFLRQMVSHSDWYEAPLKPHRYGGEEFTKTTYLKYFMAHYGSIVYCKVMNFFNRKKIAKDKAEQLAKHKSGFYD
jgi:hypothetical protein